MRLFSGNYVFTDTFDITGDIAVPFMAKDGTRGIKLRCGMAGLRTLMKAIVRDTAKDMQRPNRCRLSMERGNNSNNGASATTETFYMLWLWPRDKAATQRR